MIPAKKIPVLGLLFLFCLTPLATTEVVLKKGETLYSLSRQYQVPVAEILKYNQISDPTKIKVGTRIKIPLVYQLKKGDTIYQVSRLFNISVEEISLYNGIKDPSTLKVGTKLIIPGKSVTTTTFSSTPAPGGLPLLWPHPGKRQSLDDILRGVAISGEAGDKVIAVCPGEVVWADPFHKYGNTVFIKSWDNCIYIYAGNEKLLVKKGDKISRESEIAILGKNAQDGSARAYFFVYKEGKALSPDYRS